VTLEVMAKANPRPLTPEMRRLGEQREHDIKFPMTVDFRRRP